MSPSVGDRHRGRALSVRVRPPKRNVTAGVQVVVTVTRTRFSGKSLLSSHTIVIFVALGSSPDT